MPKKILVVDDHSDTLTICEQLFTHYGYQVVVAEDGAAAVDRAVTEEPDLILMDFLMPHGDGLAAAAAVRQHEKLKDVPIILYTAAATEAETFRGASDISAVVYKPIEATRLLHTVRDLIGEAEATEPLP